MKKLLLLGMIGGLVGWLPARAQVLDGARYWGGTINIEGSSEKENGISSRTTGQHTISPELQWGKFVNPTVMLGVGLRYSLYQTIDQQEIPGTPTIHRDVIGLHQSIAILPFIRKYKSLNDRWAIFLHGEIGPSYNWSKFKNNGSSSSDDKNHNWQYELNVKPGLVYFFPRKKVAIEGYADVLSFSAKYSPYSDNTGRGISLSTGLSTSFPNYFTIRIAKYIATGNQSIQP